MLMPLAPGLCQRQAPTPCRLSSVLPLLGELLTASLSSQQEVLERLAARLNPDINFSPFQLAVIADEVLHTTPLTQTALPGASRSSSWVRQHLLSNARGQP